jgi:hypothetical protein
MAKINPIPNIAPKEPALFLLGESLPQRNSQQPLLPLVQKSILMQ